MPSHRFSVVPSAYLYLRRGDEVLLQLRQNTGYMDGRWAAAAAGHIEYGETAAVAVAREASEELGIRLEPGDLEPVTIMQRTNGTSAPNEQRADWFFTAHRWHGEPTIMETNKCAEIGWFPLGGLPDAMPDYERFVVEGLADGRLPPFSHFGFE